MYIFAVDHVKKASAACFENNLVRGRESCSRVFRVLT